MFILRWPDESRICSRNLVWKGKFQESLFQEEVNETTAQYVGVVLDPLKPRISSKIVSGIPLCFTPDTIITRYRSFLCPEKGNSHIGNTLFLYSLLITTATDHQEPHPHPNPPPEGEGILWGFFPTWGGFYVVFSLSWKVFQSLPFQGGGQPCTT